MTKLFILWLLKINFQKATYQTMAHVFVSKNVKIYKVTDELLYRRRSC